MWNSGYSLAEGTKLYTNLGRNTMKRSFNLVLTASLAGMLLSVTSLAQAQTISVVNVDLRNARILNNIARGLNVNVSNIPITVQVPVSVAANVCQVTVNVLTTAFQRGGATCTAQSTSLALLRVVQHQINHQR